MANLRTTNNSSPAAFLGTAVFLWSTVAAAFKLTLRSLTPNQLLAVAVIASLVVLLILSAVTGKLKLLFHQNGTLLLHSALLGLLNPLLYYWVLFRAYALLPGQVALALNFTWPLALTLLSWPLLKHKLSLRDLGGLVISYSGVLLVLGGAFRNLHFLSLSGVLLALSSALIWAVYWLLNLKDGREPLVKLTTAFAFAALGTPFLIRGVDWTRISPAAWAGGAYVGRFEMGITFFLWLQGLRRSESPARAANLIYLSPLLSLLWIQVFTGEKILPASLGGLFLIIAGILLQKRKKSGSVSIGQTPV